MSQAYDTQNQARGFVLVLALFLLTICSIIGVAALMTSTTEIDIAGNEKIRKETFYQAEAGYVIGAEVLKQKEAYGAWGSNERIADEDGYSHITIKDGEFLFEGREDYPAGSGTWNKERQDDTVEKTPDIEIRIRDQFNIDVDVDKIAVRHVSGGGAEFAAGSEGMGVGMHKVIFNMDCIGTLPAWDQKKNAFMRTFRLENGTINSATPLSEIIVGYGFIPR